MKNMLKFILVSLLFTFTSLLLQFAMAKYKDKVDAPLTSNLAKWDIKVNNENINNKMSLTNEIIPVFDSNEYVKENVLAPGSEGYFDIIIDATKSDVTFDYIIEINQEENTALPDLINTGYKINNGERINESGNITGTIIHNTSSTTIRVYIEWDDSELANLDNQDDTDVAINYSNISLEANITFIQKR